MTLKEVMVGQIFRVPSMPQWGIMMKSYYRDEKTQLLVSLTSNRWSHKITLLDENLEVVLLNFLSKTINHVGNSISTY